VAASAGDTISITDAVHSEANITISKNLTIQGQGATNTAVDGTGIGGTVFSINLGVTATIQNLTIRNGVGPGFEAGGIQNEGTVSVNNSTLSGNSASAYAGGIRNNGTITISNSTLSGNSSGDGGGIYNGDGTTTISNSTLSGNSASSEGGGLFNNPAANTAVTTISFSTLSGNSAGYAGGGIYNAGGPTTIKNAIVANSSGGDCYGPLAALGTNLDTDGNCGTTNFTQVTSAQLNLGPLALNPPGTTDTLALLAGSVAIDAATDCTDVSGNPVTTDQRGVARPDAGESACDIGAFEFVDVPRSKSDCKDGKWQLWTDPSFKNQGQCIKFVNHS
jgi:hypothetical protein